jgi:ribosome-associated translation inhibitor RaiA
MQNPLNITFRNLDHNLRIETVILGKFENVKKISSNVTKCHVILEKLSKHHQSANTACVLIDLKVPHINDIIVSEKCSEDEASLITATIKTFKRVKTLLREEVARIREHNRIPKNENFASEVESEEGLEEAGK